MIHKIDKKDIFEAREKSKNNLAAEKAAKEKK